MAKRIYALAKELNIDSKQLVEICNQAGVEGKGSALASLTDEELQIVTDFIKGKSAQPKRPAPAPIPAPAQGPVPVLQPPPPPPPPQPAAPPVKRPVSPPAPTGPTPLRREDYISPTGTGGRPPAAPEKRPAAGEPRRKPDADRPKQPPRPAMPIGLAPLPTSAPPPAPKQEEIKTQKPDLKLPMDAIRASKMGKTPLAEHLRKHEEKKKQETTTGKPEKSRERGRSAAAEAAPTGRGRRGGPATVEEGEQTAGAAMAGGRDVRQLKRKRAAGKRRKKDEDGSSEDSYRNTPSHLRRTGRNTAEPRKSAVVIELPCTVRSFSEAIGQPARVVQAKLLAMGTMAQINATLEQETAEYLAAELGVDVKFKTEVDVEQEMVSAAETAEERPEDLVERAPVVTFLGHVDHGKTSLLDKIIGINVAAGERGGITQHIRAYRIDKDGRPIVFVDTPGHEAFTEMRARGATVTDIAVIVVASDDGVMPQTEEAISHAKAAEVPIVVALNKSDLPGMDINRIYQQLAASDLLPAEWGGSIEVVKTSALTGQGMDELLETLLTLAELNELKANPARAAVGTCLEAQLSEGRGVLAKMMVQRGTLKVGDIVVCGTAYGRVKALYDTLHREISYEEVGPSTPVDMTGLDEAPAAGETFYVVADVTTAREIAAKRAAQLRQRSLSGAVQHVTLENLFDRLKSASEKQTLNLILRADVRGSIEAIQKELTKLHHPEVQINVRQATVGGVTEADVYLADATDAIIIGFNVVPDEKARSLAEEKGVQVRRYDIIYKLTEELRSALEGMLKPEQREMELGRVLVQKVYTISRVGTVAGCRVLQGIVERNARVRLIRDSRIIGDYSIDTLKREKNDVREVREGFECGIKLAGYNDIKEGDVFEVYKVEEVRRTFEATATAAAAT